MPYANEKITEKIFSIMKTTYKRMEQTMNKLQNLKVKTSIKFHQDLINFWDESNYLRQKKTSVLLLKKILPVKML